MIQQAFMISLLPLLLYRRANVSTFTPTIGAYVSCSGVYTQHLKCFQFLLFLPSFEMFLADLV